MVVHTWNHVDPPGHTLYLTDNGDLLRAADPENNNVFTAGGRAGRVELYDWDGNLKWSYELSTATHRLHHDIEPLPNGNILMIGWELKSFDEVVAAGRDPSQLRDSVMWPDQLVEIKPGPLNAAEVVWEWRAWDHLVQDFDATKANWGDPAQHPELIDLNFPADDNPDWLHFNAVEYNAELDQVVLSTPHFNEFWIIDHSTTTEEAAGHEGGRSGMGGDLLYRWGNPQSYRAGIGSDQQLYFQHDSQWIPDGHPGAGNILVFNNRVREGGREFSTVVEVEPPLNPQGIYDILQGQPFAPEAPIWSYRATPDTAFHSNILAGAQRLPNGNTLICEATAGRFFEVTPAGDIVWEYINPQYAGGILAANEPIDGRDNRGLQGDSLPIGPPRFRWPRSDTTRSNRTPASRRCG